MIDLNDKDFTYTNLVLLQIRRILGEMLYPQNLTDADLINIALEIMRILMEISAGVSHVSDANEKEWDLFFQAEKNEKDLTFFIHDLYVNSSVKNTLLNELLEGEKNADLEELIKQYKENI